MLSTGALRSICPPVCGECGPVFTKEVRREFGFGQWRGTTDRTWHRQIAQACPTGSPNHRDGHLSACGRTSLSDAFNVCPPAASPQFPDFLAQLVEREKIRCIFSGFPQELPALVAIRPILQQLGASIVLNSDLCLALGEDKWLLTQTLLASASHCIPTMLLHPEMEYDEVAAELGAPFIVKPRRGSSSKGLAIVDNEQALANAISRTARLLRRG